jgi:hypothetical protein
MLNWDREHSRATELHMSFTSGPFASLSQAVPTEQDQFEKKFLLAPTKFLNSLGSVIHFIHQHLLLIV